MIYSFPKNYEYKEKLFGIINYSTVTIHIMWILIIYIILKNINIDLIYKINILTLFEFPLILYTLIKKEEDLIYKFMYLLNFILKKKLYLYIK